MQDLNDMLYFAEVVERGGFAAAGRALGIPKSRLSRRVSELEAQLGVRLLQRTTRKLSLTDVGEAFLRHCQAVRESALAARDTVAQVQTEPRGTIRVSCPVTLAQTVLGELMPAFLARHPLVRVELQVSNRAVNLVEEGLDVALRVRPTVDDSGSMVVKRLDVARQVLVASPELLAIHGVPESPQDLGTKVPTLALTSADGNSTLHLQTAEGEPLMLHHQARYVADDLVTLKYAVMNGIGVYWMPDYMVRDELERGDLVEVLQNWRLPEGIFHAAFVSRRNMAPALRAFLDYLGEKLPRNHPSQVEQVI